MTTVLEVKGLGKKYKKFALGPVDLKVEEGTAVALVGANGSGKSTLFRLLMKLLHPDEGSITLFGKNLDQSEIEMKQKVGYVGEIMDAFGHLTIAELASLISHWYSKWDDSYYQFLIDRYNIDETEKFGKTSKGTKKKVEFIISLCHRPSLLFLDEPSAGVDISSQRKMKEDMTLFMENGENSIVLATHHVDEIKHICDYITVLSSGKISNTILKDDIYEKWARIWLKELPISIRGHEHVISEGENPLQIVTDDLKKIEKILHDENIEVLQVQRMKLEEVIEFFIEKDVSVKR